MFEDIEERISVIGHFRVACRAAKTERGEFVYRELVEFVLNRLDRSCRQFAVAVVAENEREIVAADPCRKTAGGDEFIENVRKIAQDIVAVSITASIVDYVESVDIKNNYPVGIIEHTAGLVDLLADTDELVAVCDFGYFVYVSQSLDENVLFVFLSDIEDSSAKERESVFRACDRFVSV